MSDWTEPVRAWAATDAGKVRSHNEDAFVDCPDAGLWAVMDGAGGHECGEVASGVLAESLADILPSLSPHEMLGEVRARTQAAHTALRHRASEMSAARGTPVTIASTLVALVIRHGHFACLWAGDSRAYLLRERQLYRLTRDHSLVQDLVDSGLLAATEAESHPHANIITRAIGAGEGELELDKVIGKAQPADRFLLCSDGLSKALSDAELPEILAVEDPARALVAAAVERGARDNVTAVVVELL